MTSEIHMPTLYARLGGVYSIASVVDDFIDRIMVDPTLNANPRVDEAHRRVGKAGFKYLVTEMVCGAAGGPQKYTGRPMRESHEHLKITEGEWATFCKDLEDTLSKFNVPKAERALCHRAEHQERHRRRLNLRGRFRELPYTLDGTLRRGTVSTRSDHRRQRTGGKHAAAGSVGDDLPVPRQEHGGRAGR